MVGPKFFSSQIRAHYDIISFWSRNVGNHSAHPIHHSPIYGKTEARFQQTLYGKGWKGLMKHVKLLISYVPGVWPLIALLALGQLGVPSWLVVWLAGTYLWAFGTMFIPPLRCFGPGYLYLYNAVPPVMLSWVYIYEPTNDLTVWGLYVALALTLLVFPFVWLKTGQRPRTVDDDLEALFEQLKDKPKMNMAVFPLQVAEPVACLTKHAVLWGAHGLGFAKLEGWFPVIKLKISEVFAKWEIDAVLWDAHWAPSLEEILHKESLIDGEVQQQGRWRLAQCNTGKIS